jgi:hypothetical protein
MRSTQYGVEAFELPVLHFREHSRPLNAAEMFHLLEYAESYEVYPGRLPELNLFSPLQPIWWSLWGLLGHREHNPAAATVGHSKSLSLKQDSPLRSTRG